MADWVTGWLIGFVDGCPVCCAIVGIGWSDGRAIGRADDWLTDWLDGWQAAQTVDASLVVTSKTALMVAHLAEQKGGWVAGLSVKLCRWLPSLLHNP